MKLYFQKLRKIHLEILLNERGDWRLRFLPGIAQHTVTFNRLTLTSHFFHCNITLKYQALFAYEHVKVNVFQCKM